MDILVADLLAQYDRTVKALPWLHGYEDFARLPYMTLFGLSSRETNMTNEIGDGGYGHGYCQLDSRWHTIPPGFDNNPQLQFQTAAEMLDAAYARFKSWPAVFAYYNSGQTNDWNTAHHDYAADVTARIQTLQKFRPRTINGIRLLELTTPYMHGPDVQFLQHAWNLKHWKPTLAEDGVYGLTTAGAVRTWQAQHGLKADGIVGPNTLAAMSQAVV